MALTDEQREQAWHVPKVETAGQDTLTVNSRDGKLLPERALLHETLVQIVAERKSGVSPSRYEDFLVKTADRIRAMPEYEALEARARAGGTVSRQDVSTLLDHAGLGYLPDAEPGKRAVVVVNGSPASNKTTLGKLAVGFSPGEGVKFNPDDFRPILADPKVYGKKYSAMSQDENNMLGNEILDRIAENGLNGKRPNVFMDVLCVNDRRMAVVNQADQVYSVTAVTPPEVSVEWAYQRGIDTRILPTDLVLGSGEWVVKKLPDLLTAGQDPGKSLSAHIFDLHVEKDGFPKLIAAWDDQGKTLDVYDPDLFINFTERVKLNKNAQSPAELYPDAALRSPEQNMKNIQEVFAKKGVTVNFMTDEAQPKVAMTISPDGVQSYSHLTSARGDDFFDRLAAAAPAKAPAAAEPVALADNFTKAAAPKAIAAAVPEDTAAAAPRTVQKPILDYETPQTARAGEPSWKTPGAQGVIAGTAMTLQAAGQLTGPQPLSTSQKVTLIGQTGAGVAQIGLEYAGPSMLNVNVAQPNSIGIGQGVTGDVTALGRVGGGLGALGGGFGMYSSAVGAWDAGKRGDKLGAAMGGGNFIASTAFTVGGAAQMLGNASLAADATGVGVLIGVPLQVAGLGFQARDVIQGYSALQVAESGRENDEAVQSNGKFARVTGYVPGLPLKPSFADYQGLTRLKLELNSQHTKYADNQPVSLDAIADNPDELKRIAAFGAGQYDEGVKTRQDALYDVANMRHSSALGHVSDYLRKHVRGIDDAADDERALKTGENEVALGTAGRAALRELTAGPPSADNPSKLVGYNWRLDEYNRKLAPLEGQYPEQAAELQKLRDIHIGMQQDRNAPEALNRFVAERGRENTLAERQKVEAMSPADQEAYFKKNAEFLQKASVDPARPDLPLIGLSTSRAQYDAKAAEFAPAALADKAQAAADQNAGTLAMVDRQHTAYERRAAALAQVLPDVKPADMTVVGADGKPATKDGKPYSFRDAQNDMAQNIKTAQAQLDALKKSSGAASDADAKARITLQTVALQSLQIQYANNENQNLAHRLQAYDEGIGALQRENAGLRQGMAKNGLDKVPVTPNRAMQLSNQIYADSQQSIAVQADALAQSRTAFDQKFGDRDQQAARLKTGDPVYIAALDKLQSQEFAIGIDQVRGLEAQNAYLKSYQALAQKEAPQAPGQQSDAGTSKFIPQGSVTSGASAPAAADAGSGTAKTLKAIRKPQSMAPG